jgi:hypothetical protein
VYNISKLKGECSEGEKTIRHSYIELLTTEKSVEAINPRLLQAFNYFISLYTVVKISLVDELLAIE